MGKKNGELDPSLISIGSGKRFSGYAIKAMNGKLRSVILQVIIVDVHIAAIKSRLKASIA